MQSMEFSKPEYWNGILQPFPSSGDLPSPGIESRSPALWVDSSPAEPQEKPKNTGMGSLSLLQGIFLTQEVNPGLVYCTCLLYQLNYQGSPCPKKTGLKPGPYEANWAVWSTCYKNCLTYYIETLTFYHQSF